MLRILDFNVWSGLTYLGSFHMGRYGDHDFKMRRYSAMMAQIRKLKPDIICLHELNPVAAMSKEIARTLDMDCFYHPHMGGIRIGPVGIPWNLQEGDAIFARRELKLRPLGRARLSGGWVSRYASFHTSDTTQILGAQIQTSGRTIPIFSTHWHAGVIPGPDIIKKAEAIFRDENISRKRIDRTLKLLEKNSVIRAMESEITLRFIDRHSKGGCILTGDFNANPDTPEIQNLKSAGFRDAFAEKHPGVFGATWDRKNNIHHKKFYTEDDSDLYLRLNYTRLKNPHRFDYIFFQTDFLKLKKCDIVMKKIIDGVQASDHFGIAADFEVS